VNYCQKPARDIAVSSLTVAILPVGGNPILGTGPHIL
jgi:hypothetical protein